MRNSLRAIGVLLMLCTSATTPWADWVETDAGVKHEGIVTKVAKSEIIMETGYGTLRIPTADIKGAKAESYKWPKSSTAKKPDGDEYFAQWAKELMKNAPKPDSDDTRKTSTKEPYQKEIRELIAEYLDEKCGEQRRSEVVERLRLGKQGFMRPEIERALKKDETSRLALQLAINVPVFDLRDAVAKHLEGQHAVAAVTYFFSIRDVPSEVTGIWLTLPTSSDTYKEIQNGFTSVRVDYSTWEWSRTIEKNEVPKSKREDLAAILRFQEDIEAETPDEVFAEFIKQAFWWRAAAQEFENEGDVVQQGDWSIEGRFKLNNKKVWLYPASIMSLTEIPTAWQSGNHTIKTRLYVSEGSGCSIGLGSNGGGWWVKFTGTKWQTETGSGKLYSLDAKAGKWVEIKFVVTDHSGGKARKDRSVAIYVDGSELMSNGELDGDIDDFEISAGGANLYVGETDVVE